MIDKENARISVNFQLDHQATTVTIAPHDQEEESYHLPVINILVLKREGVEGQRCKYYVKFFVVIKHNGVIIDMTDYIASVCNYELTTENTAIIETAEVITRIMIDLDEANISQRWIEPITF